MIFIKLGSILGPPFKLPLGAKIARKGAPVKEVGGSWRTLGAQGDQGCQKTPKILQKAPHVDPKDLQNDAKRVSPVSSATVPPAAEIIIGLRNAKKIA